MMRRPRTPGTLRHGSGPVRDSTQAVNTGPRPVPPGRFTTIATLPTRTWPSQIHGRAGAHRDVASPRLESERRPPVGLGLQ